MAAMGSGTGGCSASVDEMRVRVRAEFLEMPGLQLTANQAQRLFQMSPQQCGSVLSTLVLDGDLKESYGRFSLCGAMPATHE